MLGPKRVGKGLNLGDLNSWETSYYYTQGSPTCWHVHSCTSLQPVFIEPLEWVSIFMSSRTGSASTGSFIHKDPTRIADHNIEAGRRDFTSPTLIPQMANVINDKGGTYDFQSSGSEGVKTYRLLPIFPGLLAPFSIMLSIPSLTGQWYIRTEKNVTTEIRPNPLLLDVALGFSMACAVLASAFLLLRFAERCVKHMTLASIAFLTFHGQSSCSCPSMLYVLT